jgi:hypothetical protein
VKKWVKLFWRWKDSLPATGFVNYVTKFPELHGSKICSQFQILIDKLGIMGTKSTLFVSEA